MKIKYKLLIFAVCLMLIVLKSFGQNTELKAIEYLTPDDVKAKIVEVLKKEKSKQYYYAVWNTKSDTTSILLCNFYSSDLNLYDLLKNSNRYIKLSEEQNITVILTSDLLFSTIFHIVKNKGKENEIVSETDFGLGGYFIEFTGTYGRSKIIKFGYYQN